MNASTGEIDARHCLSKWLNEDGPHPLIHDVISPSTETDDISQSSLYMDLLTRCLLFAHTQGLNHHRIKTFVLTFNSILTRTALTGGSLEDAVQLVRTELTCLFATENGYPITFARDAIDFVTRTLLQHYHLIQYVLTQDRDEDLTLLVEDVDVPPQPELLKTATPLAQWELETKIREKEEKYAEETKDLEEKFAVIKSQLAEEIDSYMVSQDISELSSSGVLDVIENILSKHAELTAKDLEAVMEGSRNAVVLNMEKTKLLNSEKKVVSADKKSLSAEKKK